MVAVQLARFAQPLDPCQALLRSLGHRHGDRGVQLHDGPRLLAQQPAVERRDLLPVGVLRARGSGVQCRDRGLQLVRTALAQPERRIELRQTLRDRLGVPAAAVLLFERHQRTVSRDTRRAACVVQQHQGEQAARFRLLGHQFDDEARQANRLGAQIRAHQSVVLGGRIAFVEHQVDHAEHGGQALRQQLLGGHFIGNARFEDLFLYAHQALRGGRFGLEEGTRDFARRQAAQGAQRQRHLRRLADGRVAAREEQAQAVVGHA